MRVIFYAIILSILTGCSMVNYKIDAKTYKAKGYNERIKFLIVHYTNSNNESSINTLTGKNVSSHYLITTASLDPTYQLLSEEKRGWHAGTSSFQGRRNLNDTSIGIEIVNPGYRLAGERMIFSPYKKGQILKVAKLLKELTARYNIHPTRVLGHADIAPDRKEDPGPLFPWEKLYREFGIGAWYDIDTYKIYLNGNYYTSMDVYDIQKLFRNYGYPIRVNGEWDEYNTKVVRAFQMHFRPSSYTGEMDLETFAILKALNKKYIR